MLATLMLLAATPAIAEPASQPQQICKIVNDHPLKSKRTVACGTAEQWREFDLALKKAKGKAERNTIHFTQSQAGVGSGY